MNDVNKERWKKRFEYFEKAYLLFSEIKDQDFKKAHNILKEGFVQRFEYIFELSKNLLNDYLKEDGI